MSNLQKLHAEWELLRDKYPFLKNWRMVLDNRATSRAGVCKYRYRQIGISTWHVRQSSWDEVLNTLLHEVAHAKVGPGHGHGYTWKNAAIEVGARPEACYDSKSDGMGILYRCICPTHGDIGGYPTKKRWMLPAGSCGARICKRCRQRLTWQYSPEGKKIDVQTVPAPIPTPVFPKVYPFVLPEPTKIAAFKPAPSIRNAGGKTFTYACMAIDGVRCTNGIGSRERKMGIANSLRRLPHPMTKDEARRWLLGNS